MLSKERAQAVAVIEYILRAPQGEDLLGVFQNLIGNKPPLNCIILANEDPALSLVIGQVKGDNTSPDRFDVRLGTNGTFTRLEVVDICRDNQSGQGVIFHVETGAFDSNGQPVLLEESQTPDFNLKVSRPNRNYSLGQDPEVGYLYQRAFRLVQACAYRTEGNMDKAFFTE